MDKNQVIGFSLIVIILGAYFWYTQPTPQQLAAQKRTEDSLTIVQKNGGNKVATPIANTTVANNNSEIIDTNYLKSLGNFSSISNGEAKKYTLENAALKLQISTKGAAIEEANCKQYKTGHKTPLILFKENQNQIGYEFYNAQNVLINTQNLFFNDVKSTKNSISLTAHIDSTASITQTYTLSADSFMIGVKTTWVGFDKILAVNSYSVALKWSSILTLQEYTTKLENQNTSLHYMDVTGSDDKLSETNENEEAKIPAAVKWISYKQQYFNNTLIASEPLTDVSVKSEMLTDSLYLKKMNTYAIVPIKKSSQFETNFSLYLGPNHYKNLKKYDIGLEKIINLGSGIFAWVKWINRTLLYPLFYFLNKFNLSYGVIILIMVILIRLLLIPLNYKTFVSTAKMKALKPELDALREKYKDDQAKFGQEQLSLYRKARVSMAGGCLPQLMLMPIFVTMYYFFPSCFDFRQQSFLWAKDLSSFDSILQLPFEIPFYGSHVSLFTLLMTATSYLTIWMNKNQMSMASNDPNAKMMQYMQWVFPIMFLGIFNNSPAALSFYYFVQNIISVVFQKVIMFFFIDEKKVRLQLEENMKKPVKQSGWQAKLEEAYKVREQQAKQGSKKR